MVAKRVYHGMHKTLIYRAWSNLRQRCSNPRHQEYAGYGGRGITVCDSWQTFDNFYMDMGDRPFGHTVDRIDNEKGYSPSNCRWATASQQASNKRKKVGGYSQYWGVTWSKQIKRWLAKLEDNGKPVHLGTFKNELEAAHRYNEAAAPLGKQLNTFDRMEA